MTNRSYRRLFANIRLTGRWEYGRKRNHWSSKRDGNMPELQQDSEVNTFQCEELRILSDATFRALQEKLGPLGQPARHRRVERTKELHDLLTDIFHCPHCNRRYHAYGEESRKMICQGIDCPHRVAVDRPRTVAAVVARLGELLGGDNDLIERVVAATARLDARGDEQVVAEIAEVERKAAASKRKIDDWGDLVGSGSDEDRAKTKAKVRAAQAEHAGHQIGAGTAQAGRRRPTSGRPRRGPPGPGRIRHRPHRRRRRPPRRSGDLSRRDRRPQPDRGPGQRLRRTPPLRRHPEVRGEFTPALLESLAGKVGVPIAANGPTPAPVSVWLPGHPSTAGLEEARRLVEDEHMSFKDIGESWGQSSSPAFRAYHRYYEMIGQPAPP